MNARKLITLLLFFAILLPTCGTVTVPQKDDALQLKMGVALSTPRTRHTLTRLMDGRILIVGGSSAPDVHLASVEIFDPVRNKYTPAAPLHTARHDHTATLLRDGRVLVVGGYNLPQQWLGDAEIYDPATDQWAQSLPLHPHGTAHTATLMQDGRVLVVGGCIGSGVCTNRTEIFNPITNSWMDAPPLTSDRVFHTAQLLKDGRVLVAGGTTAWGGMPRDETALVYDPAKNRWESTGSMITPRHSAQSVLLPNGRVLVAGGILLSDSSNGTFTNTAEIYDPDSNKWTAAASLSQARYAFVMIVLPDNQILALGGAHDWDCCWTDDSFVHEVESYDYTTGQWNTLGTLPEPGTYSAAVLLPKGQLWVTGGQAGPDSLPQTWIISIKKTKTKNTATAPTTIDILLDDFKPQPYQGDSVYFYNRMEGDRGAINDSLINWGIGEVRLTIAPGKTWGGAWESLNHPIREDVPIDFARVLPSQIQSKYQTKITAINIHIRDGTPGRTFKVELKTGKTLQWQKNTMLTGGEQQLNFSLPSISLVNHLVWVLDNAQPGDFVLLDHISFTARNQIQDIATAAFVWSYGMLLNNWDPDTGLVRDKSREARGEFDAIQATGSLAAATAVAYQLGIIKRVDAIQIVSRINTTLINDVPRYHGLLPHWVRATETGNFVIVENTEWSSVDTIIAAIGLLEAQEALGLDPSGTEQILKGMDWNSLLLENGISHGYSYKEEKIPYAWDVFGGESWLVQLAYASATGRIAPLAFPSPPTANGSGFIDELAWLFIPPPTGVDYWGTNWAEYRQKASGQQIDYYSLTNSSNCFSSLGLFGLSAAEVPDPSKVSKEQIYQAFGTGGAFGSVNNGSGSGSFVVTPHYSAMIASLRPEESTQMWNWLIAHGVFSPLNNVESLTFSTGSDCDPNQLEWNQLKGSWNLALQTLGWGRYLAQEKGMSFTLWEAFNKNSFLRSGYQLLSQPSRRYVPPTPTPTSIPQSAETVTTPIWDYAQVSCKGKTFDTWGSPGTYLYQSDSGTLFTRTLKPGEPSPSLGVSGPASLSMSGMENITTNLGTFQATRLSAATNYNILTGRLDYVQGKFERNEWYVCGYGLIKLTSSDIAVKTPGNYSYSNRVNLTLVSFTPLTTNESYVRYILADIQLGQAANEYRKKVTNEETAEALRRWGAGVRVINIHQFKRKLVNGQWQVINAQTGNISTGMDIILNSDSQP